MASTGLQILGIALAVLGWLAVIVVCALPMWRVTAFIGSNIVTAQLIWEGIWMNCVVQSTGQMQCKVYDSLLALSQDLQAARALSVISIVVGLLAMLVSIVGGKCTNCVEDESTKAKISITAGHCLHTLWPAHPHPCVLDCQHRHQGLLQPTADRRPEERAGSLTLHRLGGSCSSHPGRRYALLLLSAPGGETLLCEILCCKICCSKQRVRVKSPGVDFVIGLVTQFIPGRECMDWCLHPL
ncbi:CLD4 protein, partial [Polypterus senegalus]